MWVQQSGVRVKLAQVNEIEYEPIEEEDRI